MSEGGRRHAFMFHFVAQRVLLDACSKAITAGAMQHLSLDACRYAFLSRALSICCDQTRRQLDNELLEAGGTVEIRTGFVLDQGAEADLDLIKGFDLWLSHSGAGADGIAVGNGVVKVKHFTEFADADNACSGHHAAARRLIEEHQVGVVDVTDLGCLAEWERRNPIACISHVSCFLHIYHRCPITSVHHLLGDLESNEVTRSAPPHQHLCMLPRSISLSSRNTHARPTCPKRITRRA